MTSTVVVSEEKALPERRLSENGPCGVGTPATPQVSTRSELKNVIQCANNNVHERYVVTLLANVQMDGPWHVYNYEVFYSLDEHNSLVVNRNSKTRIVGATAGSELRRAR